jgi:hypothetical protein
MALAVAVAVQVVTQWATDQTVVAQVAQEMEVRMELLDSLDKMVLAVAVAVQIMETAQDLVETEHVLLLIG